MGGAFVSKIILFVDALEPTETSGTVFDETERGLVDSGSPKVTPKVTSEVYTGLDPTENGMGAAHSINGGGSDRPRAPTIQEKLDRAGFDVLSLHMPYCHPLQLSNGAFVSDTMQGPQSGPNPIAQMCMHPPKSGDLSDPSDEGEKERGFNSRSEEVFLRSSNMLNTLRAGDFDVAFVAIRSPDEYTHFQWHEDYRRMLLEDIAGEVDRWGVNHDVLWWSDHGSQEKTDVFRVNQWLREKGYLSVDVDVDFYERFNDEAGNDVRVENQIGVHAPGVTIEDGSVAVSADPYDSSIDVVDDEADADALIRDLESTGHYNSVGRTEDVWGDGRFRDECPDVVAQRADGVLVTGNVHPDPIGMGYLRTGVHSAFGAWGTTDESFGRSGDVKPTTLHDVIWHFVTGSSQIEDEAQAAIDSLQRQFEDAVSTPDK